MIDFVIILKYRHKIYINTFFRIEVIPLGLVSDDVMRFSVFKN